MFRETRQESQRLQRALEDGRTAINLLEEGRYGGEQEAVVALAELVEELYEWLDREARETGTEGRCRCMAGGRCVWCRRNDVPFLSRRREEPETRVRELEQGMRTIHELLKRNPRAEALVSKVMARLGVEVHNA